jgi:hypothetical protein
MPSFERSIFCSNLGGAGPYPDDGGRRGVATAMFRLVPRETDGPERQDDPSIISGHLKTSMVSQYQRRDLKLFLEPS